jgi:transcriptional regulator with XRE-family HTH domain
VKKLSEYQVAMTSVKALLKKQKITYRELATRLGLSESGVKKILTGADGSFQRIIDICRVLGVSVSELLEGASEQMTEVSYSEAQQEYLLKNPRAFALYWFLVYERRSMSEALKQSGLADKDRFPILRRLDQLGLLELLPGDRVRVPSVQQIRWVGGGPLIEKIYREWSQNFMQAVARPESAPNRLFMIRYLKASPRTFQDLIAAQRDLEAEFLRRAIRDMRTEASDLMHVRWLTAIDDRSFLATKE